MNRPPRPSSAPSRCVAFPRLLFAGFLLAVAGCAPAPGPADPRPTGRGVKLYRGEIPSSEEAEEKEDARLRPPAGPQFVRPSAADCGTWVT